MRNPIKALIALGTVAGYVYLTTTSVKRQMNLISILAAQKANEIRIPMLSQMAVCGTPEQSKWALDEMDAMLGIKP